ncbi:MAG: hypothetical protein ACFHW5_00265 [Verrucomicrobiota bacterium]
MLAENNKVSRMAVMIVGIIFVVIGFVGDKPMENRILTLVVGAIFFAASRYAQDTSFEGSIVLDDENREHDQESESKSKSN